MGPHRRKSSARLVMPRGLWALCAVAMGVVTAGTGVHAQSVVRFPSARPDSADALGMALDAEDKGNMKAAALAYRDVLQRALIPGNADGDKVALSLLGLERVWAELGMRDSIVPVVQRVLQLRPTDRPEATGRPFVSMRACCCSRGARRRPIPCWPKRGACSGPEVRCPGKSRSYMSRLVDGKRRRWPSVMRCGMSPISRRRRCLR